MDNASKALVISGAVLISILLVATGVYVLNTQNPELFAKNASDKMWSGVDLGLGLKEEEYEDMGENVEINTEGGNENSTTYLRAGQLLTGTIAANKVEKLTFIDTNRYKAKEGALLEEDVGATKNGEIMAYAYDNDGNNLYEVVVGQAGGVKANQNSSCFLGQQINLIEVNVKYLNTSDVTNMHRMFDVGAPSGGYTEHAKFTALDLSSFDTSKVTKMSSMFKNCSSLKSLDVSSFDTTNVTDMQLMFSGCSGLTSLDVSTFDTSNVTDMGSMFQICNNLTSLNVSSFNTSKVTDMVSMFNNCNNLTSLNVSSFNTSNVTYMSWMFNGCSKLTELDVSNFNTEKVTDMKYMFSNCKALTSLDLSGFNTANVESMYAMFDNCIELKSLNLNNFNTANVSRMDYMFNHCHNLEELTLGENFIIQESTSTYGITSGAHANAVAAINAKLPTT